MVLRTMKKFDSSDAGMFRLILGTIAMESGLEATFDYTNEHEKRHGLSMMTSLEIIELLNEKVKFHSLYRDGIHSIVKTCLTDRNIPHDQVCEMVEENIALSIALTFVWYDSHIGNNISSDIEDVAKAYYLNWQHIDPTNADIEDFVDAYNEYF